MNNNNSFNYNFCQFRNILGHPNTGLHSYRVFNVAIIDVIFTIIGALIISYFSKVNFFLVLILLFLLGIIFHRLFCVRTTVDKILFNELTH